jgi:hypothetical protein
VSKSDPRKVVGRLVGLVRISDIKGSEVESQKGVVEGFARSISNSIGKWYADLDRKRWQYAQSEVIKRLLADAEAGLFEWVIVDKAQRIGTFNERELFHFLHELERRRVGCWSVAEGDLMDPHVMRSLEMVLGSQSEMKDQRNKAQNVARGMRLNALEFRYNGGVLPYSYDRVCVTPEGVERFRVVEDRRDANPSYVPGSKDPVERRWINRYVIVYPGGHEEHRVGHPGKAKHERYDFALSIRTERRRWAAEIFRMYVDGLTRNAIAMHLNQAGADPGHRACWSARHITDILAHPIYAGRHEWRRKSYAIYSSIRPDGTYEDVEERRLEPKQPRRVEAQGVIRSNKVREDLRLIDDETLARVAKRLAEEGAGEPSGRRGRSDSYWLRPFLRCGHCGGTMRGKSGGMVDGHARTLCFSCSNYEKVVGEARRCVHNRIRLDEIERLMQEFLDAFGRRVDVDVENQAMPRVDRLELARADRGLLIDSLYDEMLAYVDERIPARDRHRLGQPGGIDVVEAYRHYFDQAQGAIVAEIAALEDRIGDLGFKAIAYPEGSVVRRKFDEQIAAWEAEVRDKQAKLVPLDERLDAAARQMQEIQATMAAIAGHVAAKRTRQAAERLREVLREIVVYSTDNPIKGGTRPNRVTDRVVFVPTIGEPIAFQAAGSKGSVLAASLERARSLWREGFNLNRIAETLTQEGMPTARGSSVWCRSTLVRLLADEIAASGSRRDGRSRSRPPRDPGSSGARR